jgi:hypothetical protein
MKRSMKRNFGCTPGSLTQLMLALHVSEHAFVELQVAEHRMVSTVVSTVVCYSSMLPVRLRLPKIDYGWAEVVLLLDGCG